MEAVAMASKTRFTVKHNLIIFAADEAPPCPAASSVTPDPRPHVRKTGRRRTIRRVNGSSAEV